MAVEGCLTVAGSRDGGEIRGGAADVKLRVRAKHVSDERSNVSVEWSSAEAVSLREASPALSLQDANPRLPHLRMRGGGVEIL